VLDAQPVLRGELRFREAADLSLGFVDGHRGQKPIIIFPDSRRAEKRWNGFRQLTDLLLRDGSGRKIIWAGNNLVSYRESFPKDNSSTSRATRVSHRCRRSSGGRIGSFAMTADRCISRRPSA